MKSAGREEQTFSTFGTRNPMLTADGEVKEVHVPRFGDFHGC
jgi:hypothetical protein